MRRLTAALFAVSCILSTSSAQYLEMTIDLAGPYGSVRSLAFLEYNSHDNKVYAGGDSWVAVIDGASNQCVARVRVGRYARSACFVPCGNKLYVDCKGESPRVDSNLYVIDGATNQLLRTVNIGMFRGAMIYDSVGRMVYCADFAADRVIVVDAETDTVVATIPVGRWPSALCISASEHKVYCANQRDHTVSVIDATANAVIATLTVGTMPVQLCYDTRDNKVYCGAYSGGQLTVIDGRGDSVVASIAVGGRHVGLCYSPVQNEVYCAAGAALAVVDCAADTVVALLLAGDNPTSLLYSPAGDKVFATVSDNSLAVIGCANDSLLARIDLGMSALFLCRNSLQNTVFCGYESYLSVAVVDGVGDSLLGQVRFGVTPTKLCISPRSGRVYTMNFDNWGTASVIDATTNQLLKTLPVGHWPWDICYNSTNDKVYVAVRGYGGLPDSSLVVIDCASDTVSRVRYTELGPTALCYNTRRGKVYCASIDGQTVTILDGTTDSVLCQVPVPGFPSSLSYNEAYDKVYCLDEAHSRVYVIDGRTDQVRTIIPVPPAWKVVFSAKANKAYTVPNGPPFWTSAICGVGDTLVKYIDLEEPFEEAYASPREGRVFFVSSTLGPGKIAVVDCLRDTGVGQMLLGESPWAVGFPPVDGKTYVTARDADLCVFDTALVMRRWVVIGAQPGKMVWDESRHRMYIVNVAGSSVSVVRDTPPGAVEGEASATRRPAFNTIGTLEVLSRLVPTRGSLNLVDAIGRTVAVIDCSHRKLSPLAPGAYFILTTSGDILGKFVVLR